LLALRVGIVIDGFGTDSTHLPALRSLPVRALKIDLPRWRDDLPPGALEPLVSAVASLAHALDLAVVLLGVDSADGFALAKRCALTAVQGRLVAPPAPTWPNAPILR
jgi:EAL domain-containing protein (putative c-di-GMP-specific phosphodiesterase class I)